jgi:hypothetical protein
MTDHYLRDIHEYISGMMLRAEKLGKEAETLGNPSRAAFYRGQLEEFAMIKRIIANRYNLSTQSYP